MTGVPVYRQLADVLRDRISSGSYPPGTQLPSERDLVAEFGVSRPTVRQAVGLLQQSGAILVEHGRGAFVRPTPTVHRLARNRLSREARETGRGAFLGDAAVGGWQPTVSVRIRFESADDRAASLLDVSVGTELCVRDRVMSANGVPVQLAVSRLPRSITRGTAMEEVDTGVGGVYSRLEEIGRGLVRFEELVGARMPTAEERRTLQLAPGTPVITVTRVALTDGGPAELNDMVLAADRYELHYVLPAE
ncbi:GntR family transcriptional regulator [Actinokineospora sp.]|uniref:GntR family transcriptional regulator n=1 Tax=Actinokineospora sp. TaxID=1872133 RepID=UPI004038106F